LAAAGIKGTPNRVSDFLVAHLGHNGSVLSSMTTDEKLDWIIETLKRMEARQVQLKTGVEDVQAHEPPPVGSFGTVNTGKKA
jgi:hypothetical protein